MAELKHPNRATLYLLYTSLCTGELNAIRKHKCFLCNPFYVKGVSLGYVGRIKPKGPKMDLIMVREWEVGGGGVRGGCCPTSSQQSRGSPFALKQPNLESSVNVRGPRSRRSWTAVEMQDARMLPSREFNNPIEFQCCEFNKPLLSRHMEPRSQS